MSRSFTHSASPAALLRSVFQHRELIRQLTWQEIVGRYRGSLFGLAWSILTPLLMLGVYTFVFSVVFGARWGAQSENGKAQFAVILFAGLAVFNVFADSVNRAPGLILANPGYVKRVVFPLELLPVVAMGNSLFHFTANMIVWLGASWVLLGTVPWTAVFLPLVALPLVFMSLGLSWFLASLGVYLRDVGQTTAVMVTGLLFLSPIFFPLDAVPANFRRLISLNPIGYIVEMARGALVFGRVPQLLDLLIMVLSSLMVCLAGFWWFQKTRKGFADVI